MVIAWIGFASIGIFMARFTRVAFGDKELLGTKVWFTFHRILMISTVLVTIVGIILIFVYAGHWMPGAHPITGIIVLVLSVIQPIAAAFRPHPGDDNRYLFNWAHRAGGIFALVLAVVTVFLGILIYKDELGLDNSPLYAMIVYCVGVVFVIAFDIYLFCKKRNHKTASFTMTGEKEGGHVQVEQSEREPAVSLRRLMLGFLVLLVTGIVIALVVLIAVAEAGEEDDHHH